MIREARTTFHRDLPLETLAHAPTIAALADAIERPGPPPSSPVVLLKNGNDQPPIFVVHGLDGSLVKLIPLVRRIVTPRPIYGIQARGFWGELPLDRIEDMAAFYLEAIRRVQPHGPYTFVGYSFGGLVSHEMTRLLSAQKEKIALTVMLDTYPHVRHLPRSQRILLALRRARGHFAEIAQNPAKAGDYVKRRLRYREQLAKAAAVRQAPQSPRRSSFDAAQFVRGRAEVALGQYRPLPCAGKITFLQGQTVSYFSDNPRAIWGRLSEGFEREFVPGDHLTMVSAHYEEVADALTRVLVKASHN